MTFLDINFIICMIITSLITYFILYKNKIIFVCDFKNNFDEELDNLVKNKLDIGVKDVNLDNEWYAYIIFNDNSEAKIYYSDLYSMFNHGNIDNFYWLDKRPKRKTIIKCLYKINKLYIINFIINILGIILLALVSGVIIVKFIY